MSRSVPILMYHGIDASGSVVSTRPELFAQQMAWLARSGANVIPLNAVVACLAEGRELPARAVVITFDDGLASVYHCARPVLDQHGFPAALFLVTACCGKDNGWPGQSPAAAREPMLTWEQVAELERGGIEIGSHTLDHPRLDLLPPEEVAVQLSVSQREIEQRLGRRSALFAYPYGRYTPIVRDVASRYYAGACTARPGLVQQGSDPLLLDRIDAVYVAHPAVFARILSPLFRPYMRLRRVLRTGASRVSNRPWA